jgi:FkbM family methyltransferase
MKRRDFLLGTVAGAAVGTAGGWAGREAWKNRGGEWKLDPHQYRESFSQQGEDIVLFHALVDLMKIKKPVYIDVGAADPIKSNNTFLLYWTGGNGVLVEPNPMYAEMCRKQRPRDKVVQAGIGVDGTPGADYFEIEGAPMLNTFSAEQAEHLKKQGKVIARVSKMPLININRLIAEQLGKTPDLVSTDIEGLDYAVIKSLDLSKYRPGVICAEGVPMSGENKPSELVTYLTAQGYVVRGGSMVNTIFVDGRRLKG